MKTFLPQNQFITNPAMPTTGSAVAFSDPSGSAATAAPILAATRDARALALSSQAALANGFAPKEMLMTLSPPEAIPASTGGPQRAPAGSAPNTAAPAGALESRLLHALLAELTYEVPLFIRDGEHLRRWNA